MLDQKSSSLNQQEKNLRRKEQQFEKGKRAYMKKLDEEYQNLCKAQEVKINKQFATLNKKLMQAERNMINKIKISQEKKPTPTSLKQSQNTNSKDSEVVRQLKARI